MEVKWIEHKGKNILYVDYREAKDDNDLISLLKQEVEIEKKSGENRKILTFSIE
jgi:hypothetical protein